MTLMFLLGGHDYIKTIVTKEQLKMKFDDENKIITVETPGGHILTMDDNEQTFSMVDSNNNSIVMDSSGIAISTDNDISITAKGSIAAEATSDFTAESSTGDVTISGLNVSCEAQAAFTAEGNATAELSASGQTTVKGGLVMIN